MCFILEHRPETSVFSFLPAGYPSKQRLLSTNDSIPADNPASDIVGANTFSSPMGTAWRSVLVRSGVYAGEDLKDSRYTPTATVDDVWDGVRWALSQEGWDMGP